MHHHDFDISAGELSEKLGQLLLQNRSIANKERISKKKNVTYCPK